MSLSKAGLSRLDVARSAVINGTRKRRIGWTLRLVVSIAIIYFVLRWFEHRQVYHPYAKMEADGNELRRPVEDVYFATSDGVKLNAWFFPADTGSPRKHLVYLLCHGNAGNISHRLDHVGALLETGAAALAFDYRGYGRSEGRPSEEGTYRDAQAAYGWLRRKGFAPANIIALGESLGGGVASELALREPVGGLILQSTYTSVTDLGAELFPWLPVRWIATIKYDTHNKLPRVRVPVLVMHSRLDSLIGFHHAEKNLAVANEPKLLWEIAGDHNDSLGPGKQRYVEGLNKFLPRLQSAQGGRVE